jgi:dGTP triphosphohydrolase
MKKFVLFLMVVFALSVSMPVAAQQEPTENDMQILLEKIKADKKLLVASNMKLSDAEAKKFWPVYDAYQAELKNLNKRVATLIQDYADAYNNDTMTDAKAKKMINEMIAIDQAEASMKKSFAPKLYKALPAVKAARYLQIENKIRAALRYELADAVPLVY